MILAGGLSPAWQQVILLDAWKRGSVCRAREVHWFASGKVLNVARALRTLDCEVKAVVPAGGRWGEHVIEDCNASGIPTEFVRCGSPTRVCTTVVEAGCGTATELVENAAPLPKETLARYAASWSNALREARAAVFTGSLPPGVPSGYARDLLAGTPVPAVLDIRGPELLRALEIRPLVVKPNRLELGSTLGRPLDSDADFRRALWELLERGAQWVVVTDGPGPVWAVSRHEARVFRPPAVETVNPIGSGDALAAGLACAVAEGRDVLDAVRFGLGCAADNAASLLLCRLDRKKVRDYEARVEVETPRWP